MGKPKLFEIAYDRDPLAVYFGGQTVQGTVTLELDEPLSARAVRLKFKGKAVVHWTETHSNGKTTYTVTYHSEEHYFNGTQELWTPAKGGASSDELSRGQYRYPFQFSLPTGLPSSFEGSVGRVRYHVKAEIDRRFRFNQSTKRCFTVINDLDLNTMDDALMPLDHSHQKFVCCLCCKSGPITASLHAPRKGYVPGEVITIDGEIENLSRRKIAKSKVRLIQVIDFHSTTKTRQEKKTLAELRHGEIMPGKSDTWRAERLLVPSVPPSFLLGCKIIDIRYLLQMNVDPTWTPLDLKVPLDVTIGSIPHQQVASQNQTMQLPAPDLPTRDQIYSSNDGASGSAWPPPPSYNESVFGKVAIAQRDDEGKKREDESQGYAPLYTYYNWGYQSSPSTE